jgi:hypothetical protein
MLFLEYHLVEITTRQILRMAVWKIKVAGLPQKIPVDKTEILEFGSIKIPGGLFV